MGWIGLVIASLIVASAPASASASGTTDSSLARTAPSHPSAEKAAWDPTPPDPLSCVQRVEIPEVPQAIDAAWAPGGDRLAVTRIARAGSTRTVTGYEEDLVIAVVDLASGQVYEVGAGMRPRWSGSGTYLSFWRAGRLHVGHGTGSPATILDSSVVDTRWVGDELRYFLHDEIRGWSEAGDRLIARIGWDHTPRFPRDDAYFSADGELFVVTRYSMDGGAYRYVGETATGQVAPLDTAGTTYTEWAPAGQTLLVRADETVELRGAAGWRMAAPLASFRGAVHGWTADGRLLMGRLSPALAEGVSFDTFTVWEDGTAPTIATLPNLLGPRSFSPDGRYFAGIARTGAFDTALEVYRCGTRSKTAARRADPISRAQPSVDDGGRPLRPAAGYISQFRQGVHTGVDVAAPFGSIITAMQEGEVTFAGWVPVGGRAVCVLHDRGVESCYYHTSLSYVRVGQWVSRGEPIAAIGMTGLTTGPHVHWEVKESGRIVDPLGR